MGAENGRLNDAYVFTVQHAPIQMPCWRLNWCQVQFESRPLQGTDTGKHSRSRSWLGGAEQIWPDVKVWLRVLTTRAELVKFRT